MLSQSILSTLSYHSRFSYPLTFDQLHHFLIINRPLSPNELKPELDKLVKKEKIIKSSDFYYLSNSPNYPNFPNLPNIRLSRQKSSQPKFRLARRAARLIGFLPWVKLVCVTGSLAMENCDSGDDIDLMIVTSKNRLWLIRPLVVFLISVFFKRRKPVSKGPTPPRRGRTLLKLHPDFSNSMCLNLWLDENYLKMPPYRQNLRIAHELAQMKPLVNKNHTYEKMLWQNRWAEFFLADFWKSVTYPFSPKRLLPSSFFLLPLLNNLLNFLNLFFFRLQYVYMKPKITTEEVTLRSAFFHPARSEYPNSSRKGR